MYKNVPDVGLTSAFAVAVAEPPRSSMAVTVTSITSPSSPYVARSSDDAVASAITTPLRDHWYANVTGSPSASEAVAVAVSTSFVPGERLLRLTDGCGAAFTMMTELLAFAVKPCGSRTVTYAVTVSPRSPLPERGRSRVEFVSPEMMTPLRAHSYVDVSGSRWPLGRTPKSPSIA